MNIKELLRCGDGVSAPSSNHDETVLDSDSVEYILNRLICLSKTVFKNIEMTDTITESLIFNLPASTVAASKSAVEKGLDFMDPVVLLYPFFAKKDIGSIYPDYIRTLRDMLTTEGTILDFFRVTKNEPTEVDEDIIDPTFDDGTDYEPDGEPDEDISGDDETE